MEGGSVLGFFTTCLVVLLEFKLSDGDDVRVLNSSRARIRDRGQEYMVTSPESVVMPINDETILSCEMNLKPDRFQWRHFPLNIEDASNPQAPVSLGRSPGIELSPSMSTNEKQTSTLTIKSSNKMVAGDYQCLAHYGASVVASVPGRITITTLEKFPPQETITIEVTAGNTILWRCDPPKSNPPAAIDYYKNDNYISPSPRLNFAPTKSLIIPNVKTSDSGTYKCTANNIIEQSSKIADFSLKLKVVNNGPIQAPKFVIPPKKFYTVNAGSAVFMECAAVGNPIPKVYWFKENGELPRNRTEMVPGGLTIFNVTSTDDGIYICNYTNPAGTLSHKFTLSYNENPAIVDGPNNTDIKEGENLDLECIVSGTPEPRIIWLLNGESVVNDSSIEAVGKHIYFSPIEKRHAGILQCFATNIMGTAYSSASLKVIPKQISSSDVFDDYLTPHPTASNHKRRKHKSKKNRGHKGTMEMIPPSRPTITRLNDHSVMVRWTVPENNGLPILFFKVQFREVGPVNHTGTHKGSKWRTTNTDIAPHIRSYEVNNLNPDHYYRFRVAAVYSNNDNKLGPTSAKFHLNRTDFFLRNPLPIPRLVFTETVNETAIRIHWLCESPPNITIDGFFVHYVPADSASDYMKITVEGEHSKSYVIQHLQPGTMYDIKLQSFTTKSASEFSPIMKQSTAPAVHTKKIATKDTPTLLSSTSKPAASESNDQTQLYIIIIAGIVGVALVLSLVVLLIACLKRKQKKGNNSGEEGRGDKDDVNHHIQADANDYVVSPKTITRANGCVPSTNRMTITSNPLADADNKNQNMIEMSCLSSQNNNCSQDASASTQESLPSDSQSKSKIKNRDKVKRNKHNVNVETAPRENYV